MSEITEIRITSEYITLGQFLKFAGIIDRGGDSKSFLQANAIFVDGEKEQRRGRKLRGGETLEIDGRPYRVVR